MQTQESKRTTQTHSQQKTEERKRKRKAQFFFPLSAGSKWTTKSLTQTREQHVCSTYSTGAFMLLL